MNLHELFTYVHDPEQVEQTGMEYYLKKLISSLYTVGRVSNTPEPIPLPDWDDKSDLENLMLAVNYLKNSINETLFERLSNNTKICHFCARTFEAYPGDTINHHPVCGSCSAEIHSVT